MATDDEPEEKRLRAYFLRRAAECLDVAQKENDPVRKIDAENRAASYWQISRLGNGP